MRWQIHKTNLPLTWGERLSMISLVPLSWLTWFGLILIKMGDDVKRDYYGSYNNNLDNKSDNTIESDNGV
ncbi:unnamed protein product [marine sediment metagenome]|uniref:Uncharacterized protein n=1 Tax=marine sediment metagenome TaxID=412755 RepID=X0TTF1_9ZZZZ